MAPTNEKPNHRSQSPMDDRQQQRIDRAAQEFTDALLASYRAASDRTVAAQELGTQEIEHFFDAVIDNLRAQAHGASQMTQQLATQQQLAREATRELARVSTDNYLDLVDSVFSFYQGGATRTQRRVEEAAARAEQAEARAEEAESGRTKAERQTEEAKRSAGEAQKRVEEAEETARMARRRAEEAESRADEAIEQAQQAEERAEEVEARAEEAEKSRSEAASPVGDGEEDAEADSARQPQSQWVRTSGRSKVRGRDLRARGRSSGRRGRR
jgi:methyl-accepting chemotaxis protein